jgi:hypothetical protein
MPYLGFKIQVKESAGSIFGSGFETLYSKLVPTQNQLN